jgi:hypothetical protein
VTRTLAWDGQSARFSAMLPESALQPGANAVELLVVTGPAGDPALQRVRGVSVGARLVREPREDGRTIVMSDGTTAAVADGAVQGWVDRADQGAYGIVLSGWAVDPGARLPTRRILVFVDGQLVSTGETDVVREDVARLFPRRPVKAPGFVVSVSSRALGGPGKAEVRVFALAEDGRASELHYSAASRLPRPR